MKKQLTILLGLSLFAACSKHAEDMAPSAPPAQPDISVAISGKQFLVLDLDGVTVSGKTAWEFEDGTTFSPSGLSAEEKILVRDAVQSELTAHVGTDIRVTLDRAAALSAVRSESIILTQDTAWYVNKYHSPLHGGVAVLGSWFDQDGTPAFVFTSAGGMTYTKTMNGQQVTKFNLDVIVAAILHEFGHTLGLYHAVSLVDWMCGTSIPVFGGYFGEPNMDVNNKNIYEKTEISYGVSNGKPDPNNPYTSPSGTFGRTARVREIME